MNILRFLFFLPLLLFSVLLSARVVQVKDSVRAENPIVWSEDFNNVSTSFVSLEEKSLVSNGQKWTIKSGEVSTKNKMFGSDNKCLVLKSNTKTLNADAPSLTTGKISGLAEIRFKAKKAASSDPPIYLAYSKDSAIWNVETLDVYYYNASTQERVSLGENWNIYVECSASKQAVTFSILFTTPKDGYFRLYIYSSTSDKFVYIDDLELVTYPWIYSTHEETIWDYTQDMSVGDIGIVCRNKAVESNNYEGVEFYRVAYREGTVDAPTDLVVEQVESLEAGMPYIYYATANQMAWDESGEAVATAGTNNGLHGTLTGITDGNQLNGKWVFYENQLRQIGDASCTMGANKGYIDMNGVCVQSASTLVPGRKRLSINTQQGMTTELHDGESSLYSSYTHPILRRGNQLVILRDGKMLDLLGNIIR